jgi:two-component system aerobic respiration control sensor histidine kinase ArcB
MKYENNNKQQLTEEAKQLRSRLKEQEVTESKQSQEDELLYIFRISSPIGLFILQDANFVFVNDVFRGVTGGSPDELLGTNSIELVYPDDRSDVRENAIKMLKGESDTPYKYRIVNKDGEIRWMLEGVTSIQYKGRRAVLGHSMDITERVQSEAKLKELYEQEKKLRKELEAEVQRRIEFTRALVHELKTPLTPVLSSSDLLLSELKEEPYHSIAQNIHRGAANLSRRIDELLDLAKVEIGALQVNPKLVNSLKILKELADDTKALISSNGQSFIVDIPPVLPPVWADEERMRQVVLNLLINASKFTPEGGTISLKTRVEDQNLVVEIQDTGTGISENEQQRLFQPYHRQNSDVELLSGLGLGLALSKNLVELMNGKIWVKSKVGKGSTFGFSLPLASNNQKISDHKE